MESASAFWAPGFCQAQCQQSDNHDLIRSLAKDDFESTTSKKGPRDHVGTVRYIVDLKHPMVGLPLRCGNVFYMQCGQSNSFERATLTLFANGITVRFEGTPSGPPVPEEFSIAWSPFALVQACRLHSVEADLASPSLRLFKVSVFHHGSTHFFAVEGDDAELERTRWVADISRALRLFTQSLFQLPCELTSEPVSDVPNTRTRILAGYLLKCEKRDVILVYAELHGLREGRAGFVLYEDDSCTHPLLPTDFTVDTPVSEHVAVDCSCFSLDCLHFTARTSAEKALWLRVVSNLKVKMRHDNKDPTPEDLVAWRSAITESVKNITTPEEGDAPRQKPQLPRRLPPNRSGLTMAAGDCDNAPKGDDSKNKTNVADTSVASNVAETSVASNVASNVIALGEYP